MKALVIGAGIAGLSAALFLSQKGWQVELIEKADAPRTAGYMIDFMASGYDAAERGGLLPALQQRHHAVDKVAFVNATGRQRSYIDYNLFRASVGGRLLSLLRGDIEQALLEALPKEVNISYGLTVSEIRNQADGVDATLSSGDVRRADLLIGADGIHSQVRAMLFGPENRFLRYLGFHTAAFLFQDAEMARDLAGEFKMLSEPGRQLGLYTIGNDTIATFFAHKADSDQRPDDPAAELARVYDGMGWHVPRVLEAARDTDDIYYDLVAQIEMGHWHKGRTMLLGDAAYAVSLLAGQGASMAVGGAWNLADLLGDMDVAAALPAFEQRLAVDIRDKQAAGRKTADWFVPPTAFHQFLRDLFLNVTALPGLSALLRNYFSVSLKSTVRH